VEDPEFLKVTLGLTVTRADAKWRKLAKLCKPEEAQQWTEAAQRLQPQTQSWHLRVNGR
jgi:hypothetical protein